MKKLLFVLMACGFLTISQSVSAQYDAVFFSNAFGVNRDYRIYLPADYGTNINKKYPVVYYFHGWGGRYKWDNYTVSDDPNSNVNGRTTFPFVMEWKGYADTHDVIIVTWDGYEPNLHAGSYNREGVDYGNCDPYDSPRAHAAVNIWGWDYRMYFRDLVAHIDGAYRTIADRDHRGVTGLSMGGLETLYIAGQNKDLVGSISAFCPADNTPRFGPKDSLSVFPILEMYRSLKGIPFRLTANDGDWLYAHDIHLKRTLEGTEFNNFEFHLANFPDHWAADIDKQLDFHMSEFEKIHPKPKDWNHICPSYRSFDQWGYNFLVERSTPALTIIEDVSLNHLKVYSRKSIPDGPMMTNEAVTVTTASIYNPSASYNIIMYNITSGAFSTKSVKASAKGKLTFKLPAGGNIAGINAIANAQNADVRVIDTLNRDYLYFEPGKSYSLNLRLINVGGSTAQNVSIKAISNHPYIVFSNTTLTAPSIASGAATTESSAFKFSFSGYNKENLAGNIQLIVSNNGVVVDTQKIVFFAIPSAPLAAASDVIILDGRSQNDVPMYSQGSNSISNKTISGGTGNGNGIAEKGEEILVYVKLAKGIGPNDVNTYHKTYMLDNMKSSYASVQNLKYEEKLNQASSTSTLSYVTIANNTPSGRKVKLLFQLESLYNDKSYSVSRATPYVFGYDYKWVELTIGSPLDVINANVVNTTKVLPNPFTDSIFFQYNLQTNSNVDISIYDICGNKVKQLKNTHENLGNYSVEWNGTSSNNGNCPSGIYFYKMKFANHVLSGKIVKM